MPATQVTQYGIGVTVKLPFETAVERIREELAAEGFGILTTIDVKATFKKKLDVEFRPYVILGACNPPLAHKALSAELEMGLLLPCNVIVYATDEPGLTAVAAVDPEEALQMSGTPGIEDIASEVKRRLRAALNRLEA